MKTNINFSTLQKEDLDIHKKQAPIARLRAALPTTAITKNAIVDMTKIFWDGQKDLYLDNINKSVMLAKHASAIVATEKINTMRAVLTMNFQAAILKNNELTNKAELYAMQHKNKAINEILDASSKYGLTDEEIEFLVNRVNKSAYEDMELFRNYGLESKKIVTALASNAISDIKFKD